MTWRKLGWLDLGLLALIVLASRAALVIHEVGGHALPAWAFGAEEVSTRMSPLGGGFVRYEFPPGVALTETEIFITKLGGIALNLVTGIGFWILARRIRKHGWISVGSLIIGAGSVGGALVYLSNGFYYGSGDPVGFAPRSGDISSVQWLWVLMVPVAAGVAWLGARHYLDFLSGQVSMETAGRRIRWVLMTLGAAGLAYGGLWWMLKDSTLEGSTRQWRLEREIARETERRAALPKPTPSVPKPVERPKIVRAEEVAHRIPPPVGPWVLTGVSLAAMLAAFRKGGLLVEQKELRPAPAFCLAGLAAAIVAAFAGWG